MELTPDQLRAARTGGCVITPATEDQVRRLTMQRRVFSVGGEPFVAARDGFFETHGTLAALIEQHRPAGSEPSTGADTAPVQGCTMRSDAELSPHPAEPDAPREQQHDAEAPSAQPRKSRARRPRPPAVSTDAAPTGETAAEPTEAEEMLAGVAAAQGHASRARVVGRGRRAGQPTPPRWTVAGKMRRGRLK